MLIRKYFFSERKVSNFIRPAQMLKALFKLYHIYFLFICSLFLLFTVNCKMQLAKKRQSPMRAAYNLYEKTSAFYFLSDGSIIFHTKAANAPPINGPMMNTHSLESA